MAMAPYDKQQKHTLYYTNTVYTCGNAIVTGRSSSEKERAGNRFAIFIPYCHNIPYPVYLINTVCDVIYEAHIMIL